MNSDEKTQAILAAIPDTSWQTLAGKRIYFGHMSVGFNIMEGVDTLIKQRPVSALNIVESNAPDAFAAPVFAHSRNGRNQDPFSKIRAFARTMDSGVGARADIALFKFCYVDFTADSDTSKLFVEYKNEFARLQQSYPNVTFVHVTVPLVELQSGPKALLKRVLGKQVGGAAENMTRHRFNELLRNEYRSRAPIFDLAELESTRADGSRMTFSAEGATYPAMAAEYSSDGSHLNGSGSRWIAAHLLALLATQSTLR